MTKEYEIPGHITKWLKANGYEDAMKPMGRYIKAWQQWLSATHDFYDHIGKVGGASTRVQRLSIHPARRVCNEWASLLLNEGVRISTDSEAANQWLSTYLDSIGFVANGQDLISRAFGLGTGAWALWFAVGDIPRMQVRRYDARMILPLSYDDDGVSECAFVTKAVVGGKQIDQLQLHVLQDGTYHIITQLWLKGKPFEAEGILPDFDTGLPTPTFAIIRPAIDNTLVDMSPYGQSVFADAVDAVAAVDLAWDAIQNELKLSKMRVFISDLLLDTKMDKNGNVRFLPFGEDDVVFRKVAAQDDTIKIFAPELRIEKQIQAYRANWQTLGDLCGFGLDYFNIDKSGGLRTATEVSADNSALMRNIKRHTNALQKPLTTLVRAMLSAADTVLGLPAMPVGDINIAFDDSIITDTAAEKTQDLLELDRTLNPWEYRVKWYGETEEQAKANAPTVQMFDGFGGA